MQKVKQLKLHPEKKKKKSPLLKHHPSTPSSHPQLIFKGIRSRIARQHLNQAGCELRVLVHLCFSSNVLPKGLVRSALI